MSAFRFAFWVAAFVFGIVAEWVGAPPLPTLDVVTGFSLLALGLLAFSTRLRYAVGWILAAGGIAWFAGTLANWAVFWDRGPLAQTDPHVPRYNVLAGRSGERWVVPLAYVYAIAYPVASTNVATIAFALALLGVSGWRYLTMRGPQRRARASALLAALAFALVLTAGVIVRLTEAGGGRQVLIAYELVVVVVAAGLTADLVWGRWTQGFVAALVVDFGEPLATSTLRSRLGRTVGDPTLAVGYWVSDQNGYVDEDGRPLALPVDEPGRRVSLIDDAGAPLAALVHDPAVLNTPDLVSDVVAATRLAVANARLQAEIRSRVAQVEASRRRLVEAASEQRRQLERELREGAERRLAQVAELLGNGDPRLAEVTDGLDAARTELRELARGIHPATLTDNGLGEALLELAGRAMIPVRISVPGQRCQPAIEAAAYFVCSEALTNVTKYADASHVDIRVTDDHTQLVIEIADDGVGGADPAHGSGLRGLVDRVEALGGRLVIESPAGQGTRLTAQLPLS